MIIELNIRYNGDGCGFFFCRLPQRMLLIWVSFLVEPCGEEFQSFAYFRGGLLTVIIIIDKGEF
jgi:hypothetical protein